MRGKKSKFGSTFKSQSKQASGPIGSKLKDEADDGIGEYLAHNREDPSELYSPFKLAIKNVERIQEIADVVEPIIVNATDTDNLAKLNEKELIEKLRPVIRSVSQQRKIQLTQAEQDFLESWLLDQMLKLGFIEAILADDTVSDILVNGTKSIYVERFGQLQRCALNFHNERQIIKITTRILSPLGRRVDESSPYVDARLQDGSRINAIIPPLAIDGPSLSIRKFDNKSLSLQNMVAGGNLSKEMAQCLSIAVRCRLNVIVVGGTGSGKTTMLNALSQLISVHERIVTIEDSAELKLQQPHVVRLETRPPNVEGRGEVRERELVKNALRMRPDRIILGEIRGAEGFDMLQAMNTGHDGSMCTIHANNAREVPSRLINMVMMSGYNFPSRVIMKQIADSVDLIVQVSRMQDGRRRVVQIVELIGMEEEAVVLQELFTFDFQKMKASTSPSAGFISLGIKPAFSKRAAQFNLEQEFSQLFNDQSEEGDTE